LLLLISDQAKNGHEWCAFQSVACSPTTYTAQLKLSAPIKPWTQREPEDAVDSWVGLGVAHEGALEAREMGGEEFMLVLSKIFV
jgi:hypothetical protein